MPYGKSSCYLVVGTEAIWTFMLLHMLFHSSTSAHRQADCKFFSSSAQIIFIKPDYIRLDLFLFYLYNSFPSFRLISDIIPISEVIY